MNLNEVVRNLQKELKIPKYSGSSWYVADRTMSGGRSCEVTVSFHTRVTGPGAALEIRYDGDGCHRLHGVFFEFDQVDVSQHMTKGGPTVFFYMKGAYIGQTRLPLNGWSEWWDFEGSDD